MDGNIIRAIIFFIPGILFVVFPKKATEIQYKAQAWIANITYMKFMHPKDHFTSKKRINSMRRMGILFIIVAIVLAIISMVY